MASQRTLKTLVSGNSLVAKILQAVGGATHTPKKKNTLVSKQKKVPKVLVIISDFSLPVPIPSLQFTLL